MDYEPTWVMQLGYMMFDNVLISAMFAIMLLGATPEYQHIDDMPY